MISRISLIRRFKEIDILITSILQAGRVILCRVPWQGDSESITIAVVATDMANRTAEARFDISVVRCPGWRFVRISSVMNGNDLKECVEWYNTQASSIIQWRLPGGSDLNILGVKSLPWPCDGFLSVLSIMRPEASVLSDERNLLQQQASLFVRFAQPALGSRPADLLLPVSYFRMQS